MGRSLHPQLRPLTRIAILALILSPLALAVPELLTENRPDPALAALAAVQPEAATPPPGTRPAAATAPTTRPATRPARGPRSAAPAEHLAANRPLVGFAINCHHIGDLGLYLDSVDRIADLGANALVVVTPFFQTRVDSNVLHHIRTQCPTPRELEEILRRAKDRGLYTALQPIVLIDKPGEKEWRGVIRPRDWDTWWDSYDDFIDHFLDIAIAAEVDQFSIGSELNSTEPQVERWERVAARVRDRFPGVLSYSANWDRFDKVRFWPEVDVMSVSSYFELSRDDQDAPEDALVTAWELERDRLVGFAADWDRPLVLSEVGYPSLPWAASFPWNYVADHGQRSDVEAQARCYRAFFRAWTDTVREADGAVAGFFCYRWDPYHRGPADTGYGIEGKPAEDVVRRGFAGILRPDAAAAP